MRAFAIFVVSLIALLAMPAAAQPRIALVVGNEKYGGGLETLNNAVDDAQLISRELEDAGFDVEPVPDAGMETLSAALERFTDRLKQAGPGAVGLFYYAGHGLQYQGTNYLMPTDATVVDPADISRKGFDPVRVLWAMQDGGARTMIVILDACRQNHVSDSLRPVAEEGLTRFNRKGLDKKRSVVIVYSTGLGEPAADGAKEDGNGPFATILAENIGVPDQGIVDLFDNVSTQLVDAIDQKPYLELGLYGSEKFAFVSAAR